MIRALDILSLILLAFGVALMLQPWWHDGFRNGLFVTGSGTILQIIVSHLPRCRGTGASPVRMRSRNTHGRGAHATKGQ